MTVHTSAGSTLEIASGLPATYDATGFAAITGWKVVGEITDLGEFGKEFSTVKHNPLGSRKTQKRKGSYDNGSLQLKMGRDVADLGQAAMIAARDSDNSYAFRVTLQDGTKAYFTGQVMSYKTSVGSVDQITGASTNVEIDSDVVEVAPT